MKWISVEDRLPERAGTYLVFWREAMTDFYTGNGRWMKSLATHWMPLPEPPEEEQCHTE